MAIFSVTRSHVMSYFEGIHISFLVLTISGSSPDCATIKLIVKDRLTSNNVGSSPTDAYALWRNGIREILKRFL